MHYSICSLLEIYIHRTSSIYNKNTVHHSSSSTLIWNIRLSLTRQIPLFRLLLRFLLNFLHFLNFHSFLNFHGFLNFLWFLFFGCLFFVSTHGFSLRRRQFLWSRLLLSYLLLYFSLIPSHLLLQISSPLILFLFFLLSLFPWRLRLIISSNLIA